MAVAALEPMDEALDIAQVLRRHADNAPCLVVQQLAGLIEPDGEPGAEAAYDLERAADYGTHEGKYLLPRRAVST
jgi:hypothetical protein